MGARWATEHFYAMYFIVWWWGEVIYWQSGIWNSLLLFIIIINVYYWRISPSAAMKVHWHRSTELLVTNIAEPGAGLCGPCGSLPAGDILWLHHSVKCISDTDFSTVFVDKSALFMFRQIENTLWKIHERNPKSLISKCCAWTRINAGFFVLIGLVSGTVKWILLLLNLCR